MIDSFKIVFIKNDKDISILNWGSFYQMSKVFYQESKMNDYKKVIEDSLRFSLGILGSFDKTKRKWFYFKDRFSNLDESDKHIARGFLSGMHDNFAKKAVQILIEKTLTKMLFRNNKTYIIDSDNISTRKAEYIITRYIESDIGSAVSSSSAET